ncbi:MAG: glycosyltransferase family 39 protein [Mycobacteriales bacterium]
MTVLHTRAAAATPAPPGAPPRASRLLTVAVGAALLAAVVLRFWTTSDLWLDEALTVNLARAPLAELPQLLRHDGAPPLFYLLLHLWTGAFGDGDVAARSLSGVCAAASLPMMWRVGFHIAGRRAAWVATLLLAASPFAVRFATEARMYSLVVLLVLAGFLALRACWARPTPLRFVGVAVCTGLLALTHYWAFFLLLTVAVGLGLLARAPERRRSALLSLSALGAGGIVFLPWLPAFVFQMQHTGTPWAKPANFAAIINAIGEWSGGGTQAGRALLVLLFAGAFLGVFGMPLDHRHIELDLRGRAPGNRLAFVTFGTMALAIIAGYALRSGFAGRYTSVAIVPFLLLVAVGAITIVDRRVLTAMVGLAVAFGLLASVPNITRNRTQAAEIATSLRRHAAPGDVVAYCPDQLGPAVSRLAPAGLRQVSFPALGPPTVIDWADYADRVRAANPAAFAAGVDGLAPRDASIWLVWMGGYRSLGKQCQFVIRELTKLRGQPTGAVVSKSAYFERASLLWFRAPTGGQEPPR